LSQALVSVVTPFHNAAPYLSQCIESVLEQSYSRFEYILSDNCSNDGSREMAEAYACRDPRIRLIRQPRFLPQVQHYNSALAEISDSSQYCKMVQADDFIFTECLGLMVKAFEQSESIGLVSSYDLKGNVVRGSGFPYPTPLLSGREVARLYLLNRIYVFGSPTTVMYRSSLIRSSQPFYDESLLSEDTEKCMQTMEHWDFGFVHQILSFLRTDNESISAAFRHFQPLALDRYILEQRYAPVFLEADEATAFKRKSKRQYYSALAREALRLREPAFWRFHEDGLQTLGEKLDWPYLALLVGRKLLWLATNPGTAAVRALDFCKGKAGRTVPSRS
jgi:glycosyltransferase involved in cell wall biosynthesis